MARDLEVGVTITAEDQASRILAAFGDNLGKVGDDTSTLAGALRRLGVELEENVEKKIEANNKVLGAAAKAFQEGRISAEDFARAQTKIEAANDKARSSLRATADEAERSSGALSNLGSFLASRFVITLGDVVSAARTVKNTLADVVKASTESEDAAKQLDNALARLGPSAKGVADALRDQASALQQKTRFDDESIVRGQAILAAYVDQKDALEKATQAAVDFAAATGTDLTTAFELLAKASQGHTETLGKYGIVIDQNIPKTQAFSAALDAMNSRFGGRAQADAQTFSGLMAQLAHNFNELEERAGGAVTGNADVRQSLSDLNDVLKSGGVVSNTEALSRAFASFTAERLTGLIQGTSSWLDLLRAMNGDTAAALRLQTDYTLATQAFGDGLPTVSGGLANLADAVLKYGDAALAAARSQRALTDEQQRAQELADRNARVYADVKTAQDQLAIAAAKLGVTLETNVNGAIAENNAALETFRVALGKGIITSAEFERAQAALAAANASLVASLSPVPASLDAVAAGQSAVSATARSASEAESAFAQQLLLTGEGFSTYLIRLNQVKAAYAALGEQAQTAAQKITGANDSMLGPLDKPGDPLPSNLFGGGSGIVGGQGNLAAGGTIGGGVSRYYQATSPIYGQVTAFKVGDPRAGTSTEFFILPNGRVVPNGFGGAPDLQFTRNF